MLEINFKNNPTKEIKQIINNYWAIENDIFIFEVRNLLDNNQKKTIYYFLDEYSEVYKIFDCKKCNTSTREKIKRRKYYEIHFIKSNKKYTCIHCKNNSFQNSSSENNFLNNFHKNEDNIDEVVDYSIIHKMNLLTEFELEVLKNTFYFPIFKKHVNYIYKNYGNNVNNYWSTLYRLKKNNLLKLEYKNNRIIDITIEDEIAIFLIDETKTTLNDSTLFSDDKNDIVFNNLSFSINKNYNKITCNQPTYSSYFILENDIILKAGKKYLTGAWIQSDGSLNISFKISTEINSKEQGFLSDEELNFLNEYE